MSAAQALAEQLAEERAVIGVERGDEQARRRLQAQHRDELAEMDARARSNARARRERLRDEEEAAALAELYRRATRSGARARIRTDIHRSAEMRALRVTRVRTVALFAGIPVLAAFAAWSTDGVQHGVTSLLGLDRGSSGWWAAWAVEPALMTIVGLIIVGRAVLRSSGGDTDWRATVAEWTALSVSVALNLSGGWVGTGWDAAGAALAHSVGPLGAAGTAFLIGLFDSYVTAARPWQDAPRLADLDLTPPPAVRAVDSPTAEPGSDDLGALVEVVAPTTADLVEQEVARQLADRPAPAPDRPRWRSAGAVRPRRLAAPRAPEVTVVVEPPAVPAATRPATRRHTPTMLRPRQLRDVVSRRVSPPAAPPADTTSDTATRRVSRPKPPAKRQSTAERVAAAVAKNPDIKADILAARLKVSARTVQRHWPKELAAVNGHNHSKGTA